MVNPSNWSYSRPRHREPGIDSGLVMARTMPKPHSYALELKDGQRQELSAEDAAHALMQAKAVLPVGRTAALTQDGELLAEISYSPDRFWAVSNPGSSTADGAVSLIATRLHLAELSLGGVCLRP
jgi:hypothetical protein